jgi:AAA+ superfamily predicted ATPase
METSKPENFHAVQLLTSLVKKLEDSKLTPSTLRCVDDDLKHLGQYLTITENQALIFSVIFALEMNDTRKLDMSDIARFLDVNFIDLMVYKTDIDDLISRRLVRTQGISINSSVPFKNLTFSIDKDILSSVFMNEKINEPKPEKELDIWTFVGKISDYIEFRSNEDISFFELLTLVEELEFANTKLTTVQEMNLHKVEIEDRVLFYEICDDFLRSGKTGVNSTLNDIFERIDMRFRKMQELKDQSNKLIKLDLIKLNEGNFMTDSELELTEKGIKLFMGGIAGLNLKKTNNNLIKAEKIALKSLFFDENLDKQIRFVQESLQNDKFVNMQERLVQMAMPKGVAAIFYGEPGTGKTETAYQLAKTTGRDIMHVDISQSKSMWFGESEKRIKDIFTRYNSLCKSCELKPILLFNEADALFGKRKDGNASSLAQTENAIQNIILEEMEKLEGILIATTNLNQNLDAAFERRFLFKIKFEKPSVEAKQKIWQSKLNWLTESDLVRLATNYSFSGGEIDNIVRKATMEEVLNGEKPTMQQLVSFCDYEKFTAKAGGRRLGFN